MDIGGYDIPFPPGYEGVIFRAVRELWPEGFLEGNEGPIPLNIEGAPEGEVFFYRDMQAYRSWTDYGARDDNADQMVHLLWDPMSVTVVVGSEDHPLLRKLGRHA